MVKKLSGEREYKVTVAVTRLEGLPPSGEATTTIAAVELRWNRPNAASTRGTLLSCFVGSWGRRRRRRRSRCVSPARPVGNDGAVEWGNGEANRFETLWCSGSCEEVGNEAVPGADSRFSWDVSFSVLIGTRKEGKLKESKLEEMGSTMVSLAEWARASQPIGNEPLLQTHTKLAIVLVDKGCVTLHVAATFMEVTSREETKEAPSLKEKMTNIRAAKSPRYFSSETLNLDQLLRLANAENKLAVYGTRNQNISESLREMERDTVNRLSDSDLEDDPIGSWKTKEFISRDKRTELKTPIFCASIDQRDETAGGESACTALVTVFANSLHRNQLNTLTKSKFDALIKEGSSEWRKLCKNPYYKERFPNKRK
ncbi:uncharacterized protein LOC109710220 [Ananas comosus]|uniref:Uncharacterized protein LOC109710220 n=1 Tax=Ananas comosus TaxID=4615 RepID=A0A6P5EWW9_ANACO|nr:uncharacterized protein LOC109710220 [Ananas comosus]